MRKRIFMTQVSRQRVTFRTNVTWKYPKNYGLLTVDLNLVRVKLQYPNICNTGVYFKCSTRTLDYVYNSKKQAHIKPQVPLSSGSRCPSRDLEEWGTTLPPPPRSISNYLRNNKELYLYQHCCKFHKICTYIFQCNKMWELTLCISTP